MEEGIIEDVEELDTVIAELEISKDKGNLILCVVNSPLYRDRIIKALKGRFSSKVVNVKNGKQIIDILKRKDFDGAEALMWVMPEEPTEDLLNMLNNFRELFYEGKIPNVMFYNQAFSENVIRKAPDFWRYRGNYYEFKETERGVTYEALEVLATPLAYKDREDLLRRRRINEYLLKKVRDKKEKSNILSELGIIFYYLGELDKALEYYGKALKLDEELGSKEGMAADYGNIGIIYKIRGELDKALEYYGEGLKLHEELGSKEGMANHIGNIGNVYLDKGELDKALECYNKALKLAEELGSKEGMANQLGNMGMVYRIRGELDKALEYHGKALKLHEELGSKEGMAADYGNMGIVYGIRGELDKALEYHGKALKLNEEIGRKIGMAIQLGNMGIIYQTRGEPDKALEYYEKALLIFRDMGSIIQEARTLTKIGNVIVNKGEKERAIDYYMQAQKLAKGSSISESISKRLKILRDKENVKGAKQKTQVRATL